MSIRVVTDSTCDLPASVVAEHGISVVPLYINVGRQGYLDGVELSREEFYRRLPDYDPQPTTATPGPHAFREVYERLAAEGATQVLSIHISISLSATLDAARMGARETSVVPVTVWDSRQLSLGTGFLVVAAAKAAAEGRSLTEIVALLEEQVLRTHVFAALDTLEFLRRSGRMSWALAGVGKLLQIKPLLKMFNGNPVSERIRTRELAEERVIEMLGELAPFEQVALVHTHAPERAEALRRRVEHLLPAGEPLSADITPVIGAHIGPGAVGFACVRRPAEED
jgi:DegV family protein with EDD domain